jgi:hypothetical protein
LEKGGQVFEYRDVPRVSQKKKNPGRNMQIMLGLSHCCKERLTEIPPMNDSLTISAGFQPHGKWEMPCRPAVTLIEGPLQIIETDK